MVRTFNFGTQLKVGNKGEESFLEAYPSLKRLGGRKGDFELPDGQILELKTDSYDPIKTPNFFMERFGNIEKKTPGGPWKAARDGASLFVYSYSKTGQCHWFNTDQLIKFLEEKAEIFESRIISNKTWAALGYLVPRSSIKSLEIGVPECLKSQK